MTTNKMTQRFGVFFAFLISLSTATAQAADQAKPPLTDHGQKLMQRYASMLNEIKAQITDALSSVTPKAKSDYLDARKALDDAEAALKAAQGHMNDVKNASGLVGHARDHWIPKADKNIASATTKLKNATTDAQRAAAQKELAQWQKDRQAGLEALQQRQAAYENAKRDEPKRQEDLKQAQLAHTRAQAQTQAALDALQLKSALFTDKLDGKLAKHTVLKEATPQGLALFAQQSDENEMLIEKMLADEKLLIQMAVAEGAQGGNYGRAMTIYSKIQSISPKAKASGSDTVFQRLALAISLEHAVPIEQQNPESATQAPPIIDPVKRYMHYEKAYLARELDPYFDRHSVWDLRFVISGNEPDETLTWGREMLRNYRPDHITTKDDRWRYVALVRTDVPYGSQEVGNDKDELQFFQNILMNGGICGRRAFFGRFILRSFGVPTVARPQRGHAALARWTPDGWVVCLGAGWGNGWAPERYYDDLDFVATTQARATGDAYLRVKRAQWIGDVFGEPRKFGFRTEPKIKTGFWNDLALFTQRLIIEQAGAKIAAAVGEELGESNESKVKYPFESAEVTDADRRMSVDRLGVITIPAVATSQPTRSTGKILFLDSSLGGKQLHYSRAGGEQDFEYTIDAPTAGTYALTMRVVSPGWKQRLQVSINGAKNPTIIDLPHTVGQWQVTQPTQITLVKGKNVLRFSRQGVKHDVAIKGFTLKDLTLTPIK